MIRFLGRILFGVVALIMIRAGANDALPWWADLCLVVAGLFLLDGCERDRLREKGRLL